MSRIEKFADIAIAQCAAEFSDGGKRTCVIKVNSFDDLEVLFLECSSNVRVRR